MKRRLLALAAALLLALPGFVAFAESSAETGAWVPTVWVYVKTDTTEGFLPLPEDEAGSYTYPLTQVRADGTHAVNNIRVTPEGVFMESATCDSQDCVHQGVLTLANRELRPLGNFIICLPHRVWLSLYTTEEILSLFGQ